MYQILQWKEFQYKFVPVQFSGGFVTDPEEHSYMQHMSGCHIVCWCLNQPYYRFSPRAETQDWESKLLQIFSSYLIHTRMSVKYGWILRQDQTQWFTVQTWHSDDLAVQMTFKDFFLSFAFIGRLTVGRQETGRERGVWHWAIDLCRIPTWCPLLLCAFTQKQIFFWFGSK